MFVYELRGCGFESHCIQLHYFFFKFLLLYSKKQFCRGGNISFFHIIKAYVSNKYVFQEIAVFKILTILVFENSQHQFDWYTCIGILSLLNNLGMHHQNINNYINTLTVTGLIKVSVEHKQMPISITKILHWFQHKVISIVQLPSWMLHRQSITQFQ